MQAKQYVQDGDRHMATSCLQQRHSKKKYYVRLVRMYTNACLMKDKLTEASLYQKFSLALLQSNQTLDTVLAHLDYETVEDIMDSIADKSVEINNVGNLLAQDVAHDSVAQLDIEQEIAQLEEQEAILQTADLPDISRLGVQKEDTLDKANGKRGSTAESAKAGV